MFDHKFLDAYSHTILQSTSIEEIHWFAKHTLRNKLASKQWLVEELTNIFMPKKLCILGSWYGIILPYMLRSADSVTCVDVDPSLRILTDAFNNRVYETNHVKYVCADARNFINASSDSFDCVINTSCEHMPYDMKDVIWDTRPVYAFQSNNYDIPEHINFKTSLDQFIQSTGLNNILYCGIKKMRSYDRYMVIGKL